MKVLVLGASGATGKQVVRQLLQKQIHVRIILRANAVLPEEILGNPLVEAIRGSITEFTDSELKNLVTGCDTVISCLGHNITFKGLFGNPRKLVSDTIRRVCGTIKHGDSGKVKLVLMSTTAYTNSSSGEKNFPGERSVFFLLYLLLPPHRDNVLAAKYLLDHIGPDDENLEWLALRPDTLVNSDEVSPYEVYPSPIRSPLFNSGKTSRINAGSFMAEAVTDAALWQKWKFKMPVIYNR